MKKDELVTIEDLQKFGKNLLTDINILIQARIKPHQDFVTPKQFCKVTGIAYSTVIYKCKTGQLKARQDNPKCSWLIHASEIQRFTNDSLGIN